MVPSTTVGILIDESNSNMSFEGYEEKKNGITYINMILSTNKWLFENQSWL